MKTTLNMDETLMRRLKREAARQGKTVSELAETALRRFLPTRKPAVKKPLKLPPLPKFSGQMRVDPADREALYRAMGGRR